MSKSLPRRAAVSSGVAAVFAMAFALLTAACQRDTKAAPRNDATAHAPPPSRVSVQAVTVPVDGMICMVCAGSVKNALKTVHGVHSAEVNLEKHQATVEYDPATVGVDELTRTIDKLGYKAGLPVPSQRQ